MSISSYSDLPDYCGHIRWTASFLSSDIVIHDTIRKRLQWIKYRGNVQIFSIFFSLACLFSLTPSPSLYFYFFLLSLVRLIRIDNDYRVAVWRTRLNFHSSNCFRMYVIFFFIQVIKQLGDNK